MRGHGPLQRDDAGGKLQHQALHQRRRAVRLPSQQGIEAQGIEGIQHPIGVPDRAGAALAQAQACKTAGGFVELAQARADGQLRPTRVGAHQPSPVDVRLVAATSIDLAQAVAAGKFHERLYHYLSEGQLELPALRDRVGDILSLSEYFLGIYSQRLDLQVPLISEAAQQVLEQHSWPGNTRELENVIHFALLVSTGDEILPEHLNLPTVPSALEQIERQLRHVLAKGSDNEKAALKLLLQQSGLLQKSA